MRVLHVIPSVAAGRGGPTQVMVELGRAQAARGMEVAILATRADLDAAGEAEVRRALGPGVELALVSVVGPARLDLAPAFVPALGLRLRGADVVHLHTVFTFPVAAAPLLCEAARVPYVVRPAGTLDEVCLRQRNTRGKRLAIDGYVRRNLTRAGAVHATSAREAEELGRLAPRARVEVVELGAGGAKVGPPPAGSRRVGYLGRLHPIKRVELLLRALALADRRVELAVAGAGDAGYQLALTELARALGVAERVRWLGYVAGAAKEEFLRSCAVLAFPSAHESFGVAVAEAMAAGRPVVVAPGVALAETIGAGGAGTVAEATPEGFAAAIGALLGDEAGRSAMGERGAAIAQARWTWEAVAERTEALYRRVMR
jgi:glycosyltransferase involved in cell wall biosynthesis